MAGKQMKELVIEGREMMRRLVPFLNLDPEKMYTSITLKADLKGLAVIETTTFASEEKRVSK
tara:strand:- start:325 stop:510 length:186 start_codon:yes stop_codon:yes gene_type:complete